MALDASPYVPITDVADYFAVSVSTIRAWVRNKSIPKSTYIKVGNTYRFNLGEVSDALTNSGAANSSDSYELDEIAEDIYNIPRIPRNKKEDGIERIIDDLEPEQELNLDDDI